MEIKKVTAGYFGKLPNFPDFIKLNATGEEFLIFDRWIQEGIVKAKSIFKNQWEKNYEGLLYYNFFFNNPEFENILFGSIFPGHDKSGRQYPFLIMFKTGRTLFPYQLFFFPILLKIFSGQIVSAFNEAVKFRDSNELNNQINNLGIDIDKNGISIDEYNQYLNHTSVNSFFEKVFNEIDTNRQFSIIENLYSILPLKKEMNYNSVNFLSFKFPVSADKTLIFFEAAFWINLFQNISLSNSGKLNSTAGYDISAAFWTNPVFTDKNFLSLIIGKLSPQNFIELIDPEYKTDNTIDFRKQIKSNHPVDQSALKPLIGKKDITLSEFLQSIPEKILI